jgi:hypothetical protein
MSAMSWNGDCKNFLTNGFPMLNVTAAAQAVWRAHEQVLGDECVLTKTDMEALAAALRAVADQVVPSDAMEPRNYLPMAMECQRIRAELLAIADELDGLS